MADELREFVKNYEGCFVGIKSLKTGEFRPYVPWSVNDDGTIRGTLINKELKEKNVNFTWDYMSNNSRPLIPAVGYYNVQIPNFRDTAMYVNVHPTRQYRKALDSHDAGRSTAGSSTIQFLNNGSMDFNKSVKALTNIGSDVSLGAKLVALQMCRSPERVWPGFRDALQRVVSGESHAVAVSRFVALCLHQNFSYPTLFFKGTFAGVVHNSTVFADDRVVPLREFFQKRWAIDVLSLKEVSR